MIGAILSQRTRDANSEQAAERLFAAAQTPEDVLALDPSALRELIRCSGFYNTKADHIRAACQHILDNRVGVPSDRNLLLDIPGVGPKTADIVLSYGFGKPAVAVDVHVGRVARRIGYAPPGATPEEVKEAIEASHPPEEYRFLDSALLELGKTKCRKEPDCRECPINRDCEKAGVT